MQYKVLQNVPFGQYAVLATCIKLQPVFKTFILSNFVWLLKTGLTVQYFPSKHLCTIVTRDFHLINIENGKKTLG